MDYVGIINGKSPIGKRLDIITNIISNDSIVGQITVEDLGTNNKEFEITGRDFIEDQEYTSGPKRGVEETTLLYDDLIDDLKKNGYKLQNIRCKSVLGGHRYKLKNSLN